MDIQKIKELLSYDPDTGIFIWRHRSICYFKTEKNQKIWNTKYSGKVAGSVEPVGYVRVVILGNRYRAHRLAWAYSYGYFPENVDHINRIKNDNRLCNLRDCTVSENFMNRIQYSTNNSGFKGVSWAKRENKWRASIVKNRKQFHVGYFDSAKDAHDAYCNAADRLHGQFSNHGL